MSVYTHYSSLLYNHLPIIFPSSSHHLPIIFPCVFSFPGRICHYIIFPSWSLLSSHRLRRKLEINNCHYIPIHYIHIILYYIKLYYIILNYIILYYIISYHIILYYIILYYIILYIHDRPIIFPFLGRSWRRRRRSCWRRATKTPPRHWRKPPRRRPRPWRSISKTWTSWASRTGGTGGPGPVLFNVPKGDRGRKRKHGKQGRTWYETLWNRCISAVFFALGGCF